MSTVHQRTDSTRSTSATEPPFSKPSRVLAPPEEELERQKAERKRKYAEDIFLFNVTKDGRAWDSRDENEWHDKFAKFPGPDIHYGEGSFTAKVLRYVSERLKEHLKTHSAEDEHFELAPIKFADDHGFNPDRLEVVKKIVPDNEAQRIAFVEYLEMHSPKFIDDKSNAASPARSLAIQQNLLDPNILDTSNYLPCKVYLRGENIGPAAPLERH